MLTSNTSQVCLTPYSLKLHMQALLGREASSGSSHILHRWNGGQYKCMVIAGAVSLGLPILWYLFLSAFNS